MVAVQQKQIFFFLRLRLLQSGRILRDAGWMLLIVALLITAGIWLPLVLQLPESSWLVYLGISQLLVGSLHLARQDRPFLEQLFPKPWHRISLLAFEYGSLLLLLTLMLLVLVQKGLVLTIWSGILWAFVPLRNKKSLQARSVGFSQVPLSAFEIRCALRQQWGMVLGIYLIGLLAIFHFAFYLLAILALAGSLPSWYDYQEPWYILQHRLKGSIKKVLGWQLLWLHGLLLPLHLCLLIGQAEYWWILLLIGLLLPSILLTFSFLLKYARYHPDRFRVNNQVATMLCLMCCIAPGLILVVLGWLVVIGRKAVLNLQRYGT